MDPGVNRRDVDARIPVVDLVAQSRQHDLVQNGVKVLVRTQRLYAAEAKTM